MTEISRFMGNQLYSPLDSNSVETAVGVVDGLGAHFYVVKQLVVCLIRIDRKCFATKI